MNTIKDIVQKNIKKYKTNCPFQIAKEKGIVILYEDLGSIFGYYSNYKRIKLIHINNKLDEHSQRFVCAHELGHAILHPKSNTPFLRNNTFYSVDKIEVEANTFAVELLIPDNADCETIYEAAALYGVPKKLAHLKTYCNKENQT